MKHLQFRPHLGHQSSWLEIQYFIIMPKPLSFKYLSLLFYPEYAHKVLWIRVHVSYFTMKVNNEYTSLSPPTPQGYQNKSEVKCPT